MIYCCTGKSLLKQPRCTGDSMGSEIDTLKERLTSMLGQLQTECGILERMAYKNKNQHRRCSYFQYILKVRRDLRLLKSTKLEELVDSCFLVITGKRPKQKLHLLESLKRRKCDGGKHNFMERLLGAARLLSLIVEPILMAAAEISILLARSFFMGFSMTMLALLARLRVLVQQILHDVVSIFNMVSSISQKKQSVKINQEGIEVFREFYPTNEEVVTLECVWKSDKFVLLERMCKSNTGSPDEDLIEDASLGASAVKYLHVESFLGDDELVPKKVDSDQMGEKGPSHVKAVRTDLPASPPMESDNRKAVEDCREVGDGSGTAATPCKKLLQEVSLLTASKPSPSSNTSILKSGSRKVAFVSVKNPPALTANVKNLPVPGFKGEDNADPFFSLLIDGNVKDSLL
ncbi:uncharacterized protein LOC121255995 isoform X2 [Juglans microcarpa x Juglans regia]|uniref:uncharacterized protein LOC121255995 isoform X2 n=1 Tax=Juglans microcarpa x Juglans regia TaxID=2249226 RepID=UPI001B7E38BD|nr:uncharacterized protein LOC121255995 isoform X2 [Juglans microcarpa x Juglans regia]